MNRLSKASFSVTIPFLLKILFLLFASRFISSNVYGEYIIVETIILLCTQVFLSIPSQAFSRFFNTNEEKTFVNDFRNILVVINIFSLLIGLVSAYYFFEFNFLGVIIFLGYLIFNNNVNFIQQIVLIKQEHKKYFILKIFESTLRYIFPIILILLFDESLNNLLIGNFLGLGLIYIIYFYDYGKLKFSITYIKNFKEYFIFAYPILFVSLFSWLISFSDRYFIEYYLDIEMVGKYSLLSQYSGVAQIVSSIFIVYVHPEIFKIYESNSSRALKLLSDYILKFSFLLIFIFLLVSIIPDNIFEFFIIGFNSNSYREIFLILTAGILLSVFQNIYSFYFILFKKLNELGFYFLIASAINIILNVGIKEYGIKMAAISTFVAYLTLSVLLIVRTSYLKSQFNK